MSSPHEIERYLTKYTEEASRILDVSTGYGKNGYVLRVLRKPVYMVGVDLFLPYLKIVKHHRIYDDVILCDVSNLPLQSDSFDIVVASEVIEHLERGKGFSLLDEIERVATRRVIVTTPNKPDPREGILSSEGFNQYEAHISSWGVADFKCRGFHVFGLGFYFSRFFGGLEHNIDLLFSYSTAAFPNLGAELIAVKEKRKLLLANKEENCKVAT
jgi:hypothetical protein